MKVGAQVMCIVNISDNEQDQLILCNGSQGKVVKFDELTDLPIIKFDNGITMKMDYHVWTSETVSGCGVSQIPLILAWALTIHKSQGATLDTAEIDVGSGIFECGQTYVALSRVRSLNGLYMTSFDAEKIKINTKVKNYYEELKLSQQPKKEEKIVEKKNVEDKVVEDKVVEEKGVGENPFAKFENV